MKIELPPLDRKLETDPDFLELAFLFSNDVHLLWKLSHSTENIEYDMLRGSAVVRRLFFDKHSIATAVARRANMRVWFIKYYEWGSPTQLRVKDLEPINQLCAPKPQPNSNNKIVERVYSPEDYSKMEIGYLLGFDVTPAKVMRMIYNKLGGVHLDKSFSQNKDPQYDELRAFNEANSNLKIADLRPLTWLAREVCLDSFHACRPLLHFLEHHDVVKRADFQVIG